MLIMRAPTVRIIEPQRQQLCTLLSHLYVLIKRESTVRITERQGQQHILLLCCVYFMLLLYFSCRLFHICQNICQHIFVLLGRSNISYDLENNVDCSTVLHLQYNVLGIFSSEDSTRWKISR